MRIVAGAARGRHLVAPKGRDVRPTADRVKEALFSSLAPRLPGASVLDLFAGTGSLGLEALSRGAAHVTFVERARPALSALDRNVEVVGLDGAEVVASEASGALRAALPGSPFDLVLADPPYAITEASLAQVLVALVPHLTSGAMVVVERDARAPEPTWPSQLIAAEVRRYGATALHRAERRPGAPDDEAAG